LHLMCVTSGLGKGGGAPTCGFLRLQTSARYWQAFTATFAKNHGHFRSFHAHLSKNLPLHDISKHNHNKKTKNTVFGEGFCHFFISALHFWITQVF